MLSPLGKGQGNAVASREQNRGPPGYLQVSPEKAEKASRSPVESWHVTYVTINENVDGKVMFKVVWKIFQIAWNEQVGLRYLKI